MSIFRFRFVPFCERVKSLQLIVYSIVLTAANNEGQRWQCERTFFCLYSFGRLLFFFLKLYLSIFLSPLFCCVKKFFLFEEFYFILYRKRAVLRNFPISFVRNFYFILLFFYFFSMKHFDLALYWLNEFFWTTLVFEPNQWIWLFFIQFIFL